MTYLLIASRQHQILQLCWTPQVQHCLQHKVATIWNVNIQIQITLRCLPSSFFLTWNGTCPEYMSKIDGYLIRSRNCLPFQNTWVYPCFFGGVCLVGSVYLVFFVFCVVLCYFACLQLCLVCSMLPVFLDCPFLITLSPFSNECFNTPKW